MSDSFTKGDEYDNGCKVCPNCGSPCHPLGTNQLKMCIDRQKCKWKDDNWTLDKDQSPIID